MNKSERINDMMLFLNDKNIFNLKDLMEKYSISKSTALRDVEALERIGMPIYSQSGRNGYYGILRNRLLSPIVFNMDEVYALYFSMLTLRDYESTPFHLCAEKLKKKFELCLSPEKIDMLRRVERVFSLAGIQHRNHCEFLSAILQSAIEEKVCIITYRKNGHKINYSIQFFNISSAYGQWYATGYDFETDSPKVFRCDKIMDVRECSHYKSKPLEVFEKSADKLYKMQDAVDFKVEISERGADIYYKEHYPSMKLCIENGRYFIQGFYNKGEEKFIADYFIAYGESIIFIQTASLKAVILERLHSLKRYFADV